MGCGDGGRGGARTGLRPAYLRRLHAAEDERLSVELGPAVEVEHAYVADVGSVRLSRHRVQILQQKLQQSASVKLVKVCPVYCFKHSPGRGPSSA